MTCLRLETGLKMLRTLTALALASALMLCPAGTGVGTAWAAESSLPAEGPITPPVEPADTGPLIVEGKRLLAGEGIPADRTKALTLFQQAAAKGSADGRYLEARTRMENADPGVDAQALESLFALARQGHGDAAMFAAILCLQGKTGNPEHGALTPFLFNIARRAGNPDAVKLHPRLVTMLRDKGQMQPGSGTGDSIGDPIIFSEVTDHTVGVATEYEAVSILYSGGKVVSQSLVMQDDKEYDVLTIESPAGHSAVLYFSISNWYGKGPLMESVGKGK